jgi:ribokinase
MSKNLLVMGSFVADTAYRAARLPAWGETLMGSGFALGPGGKGSNQAVAAARALAGSGATVQFLSKLGDDAFGQLARVTWAADGIDASLVGTCDTPTGAAAILIDEERGENAIIVVPGACFTLTPAEVDAAAAAIRSASVFLTQLELPLKTVERGLEIAREAGVPTILNPAPAQPLPDSLLRLADFLIPNESEASLLTGLPVESVEQAERAARSLLERGARNVIVTLGERGALVCLGNDVATLVPAFAAGAVVETTGAGDAFCGGFAAALHEGLPVLDAVAVLDAVRFGCATAGISVTRSGTAPSMPQRQEIDGLLEGARS